MKKDPWWPLSLLSVEERKMFDQFPPKMRYAFLLRKTKEYEQKTKRLQPGNAQGIDPSITARPKRSHAEEVE